jgi:hypothetical protein
MRIRKTLSAVALGVGIAVAQVGAATAQGMEGMGPGTMQGGTDQETMGQGMMGRGMMQRRTGPAATGQCMMHSGAGSGMMEQHMGRGMMMGSGMMGSGMMQGGMRSGMGALFGSRVTPPMTLSVDDVRGYLGLQLKRLNNRRLKVGDVKSDDDTITADIATVDNSLVQRLKVDRHTGAIQYEN